MWTSIYIHIHVHLHTDIYVIIHIQTYTLRSSIMIPSINGNYKDGPIQMTSLALLAAFNFDQDKFQLQTQPKIEPGVNKQLKLNPSHSDRHTDGSHSMSCVDTAAMSQDSSMDLKLYAESAAKSQNSSTLENDPLMPKSTTTTLTPSAAPSSQTYERHSSIMRSVYTLKFAPALVLKTKRESTGEKVFINILKGWISDEHDKVCTFLYIHLHAPNYLLTTYVYIATIITDTWN